jgi:hypothetical protein
MILNLELLIVCKQVRHNNNDGEYELQTIEFFIKMGFTVST